MVSMASFPAVSLAALTGLAQDPARILVLTVNNRHARRLLADWSAQDPARAAHRVARIMPLSAWMRQAADALAFAQAPDTQPVAAHVLDAFGAQQVWTQVIEEQEPQRPLLDARQAARLAMEADRLMTDWHLHVPQDVPSIETARFAQWRQAYLARLRELDAQDDVRLAEAVLHAAVHDALPLPFDVVALAGFTECTPILQTLLTHLQRQGLRIVRLLSMTPKAALAVRTTSPMHDTQWRDAAAWAARQVHQHPRGRFAIVAASLEADMPFAHRVLREALKDAPYNVTVARPLAEWPLARAAQAWLRVLTVYTQRPDSGQGAPPACVGTALLAGACAGHRGEASARAGLDALWRRQGLLRVARHVLTQQLCRHAPLLAQAWQAALAQALQDAPRATLDVWMARFRRDLQALGFPGDAAQDSVAHQTLQALELALDRAAAQAFAFGDLRRAQALSLLDGLLAQTRFQAMRDPAARLDVLGVLEADGGQWDAVWVLGLHDAVLPAAPRPNPLLPLAVLRDAGTPRATLARELQWAQSLRDALLHCAPRVLFSHAQQQGEQWLRVSPLLSDLPEIARTVAVQDDWHCTAAALDAAPDVHDAARAAAAHAALTAHDLVQASASDTAALDIASFNATTSPAIPIRLETLLDDQGPPLTGSRHLRGGVDVIDTQSRHPLWAFVKYRLGARQLDDYAQAADPKPRGNFLHHCMELIWRLLPDQAALQQSWEQNRLPALVHQAIVQAADKCLQDYGPVHRQLEIQRAEHVLHVWLALERDRAPFRIEALEQTVHWREGPLELRVRLDRVDRLADGDLVVMDYKTGAGNITVRNDWMRERPVNVQLPFYAAMLPHAQRQVVALMLVKLHARGPQLRGLARDPDMHGVSAPAQWPLFAHMTWDEVMQHWRSAIQGIARELADGVASNVVRRASDLQYCDVLPFLRLNEIITGQAHVAAAD